MLTWIEERANRWIAAHTQGMMRRALGLIFIWFGALKFCPGLCDVEVLAQRTMTLLTFHVFTPLACLRFLAVWEVAMGMVLLLAPEDERWGRRALRIAALMMVCHLIGTFFPLVLFPADTWKVFPFAPTLAGQYIMKNVVLLAAALGVYVQALSRRRRRTAELRVMPAAAQTARVPA